VLSHASHARPLNAASHGCVRIPLGISVFLHKLIHVNATQDDSGI
jgi:hypothetical protein